LEKLKFKIVRADGFEGYAGYMQGSINNKEPMILEFDPGCALLLLNVEATFGENSMLFDDGTTSPPPEDKKRHIISALMHEFGHALEEHFALEFNEDWIERVVESWKEEV